jgi:probable rRNA maturation factor
VKIEITILNQQKKIRLQKRVLEIQAHKVFDAMLRTRQGRAVCGAASMVELSVVLVNNRAIRRLNRSWRGVDSVTDVIAFPLDKEAVKHGEPVLGDVIISVEQAERQARQFGHSLTTELRILLTHGILHTLGWRDDTPRRYKTMAKKVQELL